MIFISVCIFTVTLSRHIFTDPALMVLQRVRILKVLLTILTLETLSGSVYILHVSVQTVLVERLVAIRTLDLALLPDS